jgi:hypothetical protein
MQDTTPLKRPSFFVALALVSAGLLLSAVVIEGGFRLTKMFSSSSPRVSDRPRFYVKDEAASTLQDYAYETLPAKGTFRIAVVGDSYTFAPYMQFLDAFPKVLERLLNLNTPRDKDTFTKTEVINYGVPAYSTSHEIALVERAIKEGAHIIIMQITLNDPEIKPFRPIGITSFTTWGSYTPTGWKKSLYSIWSSLGFIVERIYNEKTRRDYISYFLNLFESPKSYRQFESSFRSIAEIAKSHSIPLYSVLFPLFGVPLDDDYPFHPCHKKVEQLMKDLSLPFLDLFSHYKGLPIERLQVIPGEDRHPNEIAHRMGAESIYEWLTAINAFPESLVIRDRFEDRTKIIKEKRISAAVF